MDFQIQPKPGGAPAPAANDLSKIPLEDPNFDPTSIPLIKAVADAEVPGVVLSEADLTNPELEPLAKNGRAIFEKTPVSLYKGKTGIALFNPGVIKPEEIKRLDDAGKLDQVLAPASQFLGGGEAPAAGGEPAPMSGGMPSAAPAGMQRARARSSFASSLPPTRQPVPTGGSLLNDFVRSPA